MFQEFPKIPLDIFRKKYYICELQNEVCEYYHNF